MTRCTALLLIWLAVPPFASAQANIDTGCPVTQKIQPDGTIQFVDCKGRVTSQSLPVTVSPPAQKKSSAAERPSVPSSSSTVSLPADSAAAVAYQHYLEAYYKYQAHSLDYAQTVFDWQYKSSIVIFMMVILLVLTGLVFAGIQFTIAMKAHPTSAGKKKEATATDQAPAMATTLEASAHGVKITSSVIGLLILVVSIGFFYLYLVYVYPIQNIAK